MLPFQRIQNTIPIHLVSLKEFIAGSCAAPHRNDYLMLLWVIKGSGYHRIDEKEYEMVPDRLFIIQEGQVHSISKYPDEGWLILSEEAVITGFLLLNWEVRVIEMLNKSILIPYIDLGPEMKFEIGRLLQKMETGLKPHKRNLKLAQHYFIIILLILEQGYFKIPKKETPVFIRRVKIIIQKNFTHQRKLSFYSETLQIKKGSLDLFMKKKFGKSISQVISHKLLTKSKILLLYSAKSINEISTLLGFTSPGQFSVFLKKNTGYSPGKYRLNNTFV